MNTKNFIQMTYGKLSATDTTLNRLRTLGYNFEQLEAEISAHDCNHTGAPAVYCGTYAKYNSGSLCGMWIDLTTFDSYEEFISFCNAIHADEEYPELMFQDFEGFPEDVYCECGMSKEAFDSIQKYAQMCDSFGKAIVDDFLEVYDFDQIDELEDRFSGVYDTEESFAEEIVNEVYDLDKMGDLIIYFDYDRFARDLFITDYYMGSNGAVFHRA